MKIIFATDIDGVIADTYEVIRRGLLKKYGINFPFEEHIDYNFNVPNVSDEELNQYIGMYIEKHIDESLPIPGSINALKRISALTKQPIYFITARPKHMRDSTMDYLRKYLDFPLKLILTEFKPKQEQLIKNNITHYVDDRFKEVERCADYVKHIFCFNQPWNKNRTFNKRNVVRINNLSQIIPLLLETQC